MEFGLKVVVGAKLRFGAWKLTKIRKSHLAFGGGASCNKTFNQNVAKQKHKSTFNLPMKLTFLINNLFIRSLVGFSLIAFCLKHSFDFFIGISSAGLTSLWLFYTNRHKKSLTFQFIRWNLVSVGKCWKKVTSFGHQWTLSHLNGFAKRLLGMLLFCWRVA